MVAAVEMQIRNERGREGSDAVVGEVASHHNQADEHQDGEAVGTSGWMEESQRILELSSGNGRKI